MKLLIFWGLAKKDGAAEGTRTPDPIITNDVLYQLSYSGILLCPGVSAPRGLAINTAKSRWVALNCAAGDVVGGQGRDFGLRHGNLRLRGRARFHQGQKLGQTGGRVSARRRFAPGQGVETAAAVADRVPAWTHRLTFIAAPLRTTRRGDGLGDKCAQGGVIRAFAPGDTGKDRQRALGRVACRHIVQGAASAGKLGAHIVAAANWGGATAASPAASRGSGCRSWCAASSRRA